MNAIRLHKIFSVLGHDITIVDDFKSTEAHTFYFDLGSKHTIEKMFDIQRKLFAKYGLLIRTFGIDAKRSISAHPGMCFIAFSNIEVSHA